MSVLALHAGTSEVTAVVVGADGTVTAHGHRPLTSRAPQPGWDEQSPEEIWQAVLGATRDVLATTDAAGLDAVGVAGPPDTVLLWDQETLGSPRPAITGADRRSAEVCARLLAEGRGDRVEELTGRRLAPGSAAPTLRWLAEEEPHTWALVEAGRYAIGTVESYLVARMTRGTWHVVDRSQAARTGLLDLATARWSVEVCDLLGVPLDALPEVVPSWGEVATTEPRTFAGIGLPVTALVGAAPAAQVARAGHEPGGPAVGAALLAGLGAGRWAPADLVGLPR